MATGEQDAVSEERKETEKESFSHTVNTFVGERDYFLTRPSTFGAFEK